MTRIPTAISYLSQTAKFLDGTSSPREFLESCIKNYEKWEPSIKAFVQVDLARARVDADASSLRWKAGQPLSRIDGMPVGVKDIIETAHLTTEQGSPLFARWQSVRDAASVSALREAGAYVFGKTVTTEFAATEPGPTRNPWDTDRTPGGSSSGSAAAVAAGIVPVALGSQVIGSVIRPASYCGCVGYKPSLGAINRGGSFDYLSQSCVGILGNNLEETWAVAREISSRVGGDPGAQGLSGPMNLPDMRKPQTVALLQTEGFASLSPKASAAFDTLRNRLGQLGISILTRRDHQEIESLERCIAEAGLISRSINAWESRWPLNTYATDVSAEGLSPAMRSRLSMARAMSLEEYHALLKKREDIRSLYAQLSRRVDCCMTLSAPDVAPVGISSTGDPSFAIPGSLLGVPAISVPVFQIDGMPLGVQVLGFNKGDADAFAIAAFMASDLRLE